MVWGGAQASSAGPGRARPPNAFWRILGLNLRLSEYLMQLCFFKIIDTLSHNIISHKMDEPIIRVVSKSLAALLRYINRKPVVPNHGNTSTQCTETEWLTYVCKFENIHLLKTVQTKLLLFGILSRTPWEPVADPLWSADPSLKTADLYDTIGLRDAILTKKPKAT